MTDADMTRPEADDKPKDPHHAPAVVPSPAGEESESGQGQQGDHDATDIEQTGGKVANPYMQ